MWYAELALMLPDAILVNCARGPVIDKQVMDQAINKNIVYHYTFVPALLAVTKPSRPAPRIA